MRPADTVLSALKSRRRFLEICAALSLTIFGFLLVLGQDSVPLLAQEANVPMSELMAGEALPDLAIGAADAPVTIVEYASMTCPHCAAFAATTYPGLKSKYIDTGKVRFILREFPLDPLAAAGFMLARCSGDDKRNAVVDLLFAQQNNWIVQDDPASHLANILKQTGMSQAKFEACLKDNDLRDKIYKVHDRGAAKFGVTATPTFFVNGKKTNGEMTLDALAKLIDPLLKS
ncbi:MAG TPA: DsbA family protein [Methylocella sp.]|nr:DsbA family protein [Methylocella sp.]